MKSYTVTERMGLPVWDGDYIRDIKHFYPGDTITDGDFEEARQDEDQVAELVKYNTEEGKADA